MQTAAGKVLFDQLGPLHFSQEYCEWLARAVAPKIVTEQLEHVKFYINTEVYPELEQAQVSSQDAVEWILEELDTRIGAAR